MIKMVLYDPRKNSSTNGKINEFFMGVHIPPEVYHGFKGISEYKTIMLNCPSEPYNHQNPDEYQVPAHAKKIPYKRTRKDG
jgi:dTDP-4-dehydrorhamnose 3,5-epimerase